MGVGYLVSCPSCGLGPFEIMIGSGMHPDYEFFTERPTWCKRCKIIGDHEAVKSMVTLRERLADDSGTPWSSAGGAVEDPRASRRATLELLIRGRQRPRCGTCDRSVTWMDADELEAGTAECPACAEGPLTIERTLLWD